MKDEKSNPQDFQKNKGEKQEVKTPDEDKEISENIAVEAFKDEPNNKNKIKEKEKKEFIDNFIFKNQLKGKSPSQRKKLEKKQRKKNHK